MEGRFRAVAESVQDALVAADAHGRVVFFSPSAERIFGWSAEEIRGRPLTQLMPEELRAAHDDGIRRLREGGPARIVGGPSVELTALRRDGSVFPMELTLGTFEDDGERFFTGVIRDTTERVRAGRLAAAQYEVAAALAGSHDLDEALVRALAALGAGMGWIAGHLWLVDDDAGLLRRRASWSGMGSRAEAFQAASEDIAFRLGEGLPGRVWATGSPLWLTDVLRDGNFPRHAAAAASGLHAAVGLPVVADGVVQGVLEFFAVELRAGDEELISAMAAMAGQVGQFLLRREAQARLAHAHDEIERRDLMHRQAADLNDEVVQNLVLARYRMDAGDHESAAASLTSALESARTIVSDLLEVGGVEPGQLRRSKPAARDDA